MWGGFGVLFFGLLCFFVVFENGLTTSKFDKDACYSFAGGSVYPAEAKHAGHQLHTTKAVSKYFSTI